MSSDDRLDVLIDRHLAGALTAEEAAELETWMSTHPDAQDRMMEAALQVVDLSEALGRPLPEMPEFDGDPAPKIPIEAASRPWIGALAAAALVALIGISWMFGGREPSVPRNVTEISASAGDHLDLGGTRVAFKEPSTFRVSYETTDEGRRPLLDLNHGHIEIETAGSGHGLRVRTPSGDLRNIGTRFSVRVQRGSQAMTRKGSALAGIVSVMVLTGLVEWTPVEPAATPVMLEPSMGMMTLRGLGGFGEVKDREGLAQIRRRTSTRWTLAVRHRRLQPGDLVRTGTRGAHLAALTLDNGVGLTLGPAGQIEVESASSINLMRGEVEVNAPKGVTVKVSGLGRSIEVKGRQVVSVASNALVAMTDDPRWLATYKGDAVTDAMGALLANIDGRDVPLTMGWHKVNVDINDRIARTVIEETFVNHTNETLEGVFYFPLPAGASVSSFAMWVGGRKVHGEIVEKGRAREIYETILREKRDPGLLEWTGGNIFRARVYPIVGTKRIQISYTQVLPKSGDGFAYRYGLRSELTRLTPLEKLEIDVKIASSDEILDVTCESHACRIDKTARAARIEYSALDITPDRDLEIRVRTGAPPADQPKIGINSHRRDDDGFFMVRVGAPRVESGDGPAPRNPIDVIVVADTSASMYGPQRRAQEAFIEALLAGLDDRDRFQLLTADVTANAAFLKPRTAIGNATQEALEFLERRQPLGWSDLGKALEDAFSRAKDETHIIYVGDGVHTRSHEDAAAFLDRMRAAWNARGTVHTVVPGSSQDALILRGLAEFGGGSYRALSSVGGDAARAAADLLESMTGPGLRDLKLQVDGIEVAAVHPASVSHVPAGDEIIVVGRYDATATALTGTVRLSARVDGKRREWIHPIDLSGADRGESFIPRLWARRELDHLQREGATAEIVERIIRLSEDYQIITPYTSFLVLESDEDRERFGVKKRFRIRDGEEYFAKGRETARFELLKKQIKLARLWRQGLRERILKSFNDMARGVMGVLRPQSPQVLEKTLLGYGIAGGAGGAGEVTRGLRHEWYEDRINDLQHREALSGWDASKRALRESFAIDEYAAASPFDARGLAPVTKRLLPVGNTATRGLFGGERIDGDSGRVQFDTLFQELDFLTAQKPFFGDGYVSDMNVELGSRYAPMSGEFNNNEHAFGWFSRDGLRMQQQLQGRGWNSPSFAPDGLWPKVPPPTKPGHADSRWPQEITDLLRACDRRAAISKGTTAWRFVTTGVSKDDRDRDLGQQRGLHLLSANSWWTTPGHLSGDGVLDQWLSDGTRGIIDSRWRLGRTRPAMPEDSDSWTSPFSSWFDDLAVVWRAYVPTLERLDGDRARVTLRPRQVSSNRTEILVDTKRNVVLGIKRFAKDEVTYHTRFEDLTEVGGLAWPTRITHTGKGGRVTFTMSVSVSALTAAEFDAAMAERKKRLDGGILMKPLTLEFGEARSRFDAGTSTLEDVWGLWSLYGRHRRMIDAKPFGERVVALTGGKLGSDRIRFAHLVFLRRNEEAKNLSLRMTAEIAKNPRESDLAAVRDLLGHSSIMTYGERLTQLDGIKAVWERQARLEPTLEYERNRADLLRDVGFPDRALEARARLASDYPLHDTHHTTYASLLGERGDVDAAIAHLAKAEKDHGPWSDAAIRRFWKTRISVLESNWRLEDAVATLEAWMTAHPDSPQSDSYDQHLSHLTMLDRVPAADRLKERWLRDALVEKPSAGARNRLSGALNHILGAGRGFWNRPYDHRWNDQLAKVLRHAIDTKELWGQGSRITRHQQFRESKVGATVMKEIFDRVDKGVATMEMQQWTTLFDWVKRGGWHPEAGAERWRQLVEAFLDRWMATREPDTNHWVWSIVGSHGTWQQKLAYRRHAVAVAPVDTKARERRTLFDDIVALHWSGELESELWSLWPQLESDLYPEEKDKARVDTVVRVSSLARINDWMMKRVEARLDEAGDRNDLTRRELDQRKKDLTRETRRHIIARLRPLEASAPEPLRPWVRLERFWFEAKIGELTPATAPALWAILRPAWERTKDEPTTKIALLDRILILRSLATLARLSLEDGADAIRAELFAFLDPDTPERKGALGLRDWRYRLNIALDRVEDVTRELREWYGNGSLDRAHWGRPLAYVLAEGGDLESAVPIFDKLADEGMLNAKDLGILATWKVALDDHEGELAARAHSFETMNEWNLGRWIDGQAGKYDGDSPPPDLDPQIPVALNVLTRKSQDPSRHMGRISRLYASTRDFRLLACMANAVIGQTGQKIYPYLGNARKVLQFIQEEATLDQLMDHIVALQAKAQTDVDRRALHMLTFLAQFHALEQGIGVKDHARSVRAALEAARKGTWHFGEREAMANLLSGLHLRPDGIVDFAADWLRELHTSETDAIVRFRIAARRSTFLWDHARRDRALLVERAALSALKRAYDGRFPRSVHGLVSTHCHRLRVAGHYREGETLWQTALELAENPRNRHYFERQLFAHYRLALTNDAEVSLGKGRDLWRALEKAFDAALLRPSNESHANTLVAERSQMWDAVLKRNWPGLRDTVSRFAFSTLPRVMALYQHRQTQNMIENVSARVESCVGISDALRFMITRAENQPAWLTLRGEDFWARHAGTTASLFVEMGMTASADLERRLLALVEAEMRRDFSSRRARSRMFYSRGARVSYVDEHGHRHHHQSAFWAARKDVFLKIANEAIERAEDEDAVAYHTAQYLWHGLEESRRAIDVLAELHGRGKLSVRGRRQLGYWLKDVGRWSEALTVLMPLSDDSPSDLEIRRWIMQCAFRTEQNDLLRKTLADAEQWLRDNGRDGGDDLAQLAAECNHTHLPNDAVRLFKEAINLRTRGEMKVRNDGTLASWYRGLSKAYSTLGRTGDAIDAAAGAVVCWPRNSKNRRDSLDRLVLVMARAKDLDSWVAKFEEELADKNMENPLMRRAIARAYMKLARPKDAARHADLALEASPDDMALHDLAIKAWDAVGKAARRTALDRVLAAARAKVREPHRWIESGNRLEALGDEGEAERAWTTAVEMMTDDTAGYVALAGVRERQKQFTDALALWRRVDALRPKQPEGLLGIANMQISLRKGAEAQETIDRLKSTDWKLRPADFDERLKSLQERVRTLR